MNFQISRPSRRAIHSESPAKTLTTVEKHRAAILAELNRLMKFLAKAEQRILARRRDYHVAEARSHWRRIAPDVVKQSVIAAQEAWDREEDARLGVVEQIRAVCKALRRAEAALGMAREVRAPSRIVLVHNSMLASEI